MDTELETPYDEEKEERFNYLYDLLENARYEQDVAREAMILAEIEMLQNGEED